MRRGKVPVDHGRLVPWGSTMRSLSAHPRQRPLPVWKITFSALKHSDLFAGAVDNLVGLWIGSAELPPLILADLLPEFPVSHFLGAFHHDGFGSSSFGLILVGFHGYPFYFKGLLNLGNLLLHYSGSGSSINGPDISGKEWKKTERREQGRSNISEMTTSRESSCETQLL